MFIKEGNCNYGIFSFFMRSEFLSQELPPPPGGTAVKFEQGCAAKALESWPYLRTKKAKIDTLLKAQTWKTMPYSRDLKTANLHGKEQIIIKIAFLVLNGYFSF